MSTRLFLRLERDSTLPGSRCEWILRDRQGTVMRRGRDVPSEVPRATSIIGVIDQSLVATRSVRLPPGRRARAPAALANAMEPYLLSDPTANRVMLLGTAADGDTVLAAVDRDWLDGCLRMLSQAERPLSSLLVESSLIERVPGVWTPVCRADGGFLCLDDARVIVLDATTGAEPPQGLRWELERLAPDAPKPRLRVHHEERFDAARWRDALGIEVEDGGRWNWADATHLDRRAPARRGADLLPQLQNGADKSAFGLEPWRLPAAIAASVLVVHVGATAIAWWQARAERERLRADIARHFVSLVGPNEPVVDAVLQSRRALGRAQRAAGQYASDDFVALLGRLSAATAVAAPPELLRLQYQSGVLSAEWRSTTKSDALESVARSLRNEGLQAELAARGAIVRLKLGAAP
jgi:type II secretion system protein L